MSPAMVTTGAEAGVGVGVGVRADADPPGFGGPARAGASGMLVGASVAEAGFGG